MKKLGLFAVLLSALVFTGCSEQAAQETKDAVDATADAATSAAADTADAAKSAVEDTATAVKEGAEDAKKMVEGEGTESAE